MGDRPGDNLESRSFQPSVGDAARFQIGNAEMATIQKPTTASPMARSERELFGSEQGGFTFAQFGDIYGKAASRPDALLASNPADNTFKALKDGYYDLEHPGRKNPDAKVDYGAAKEAYGAFHLDRYGIDTAAIPAIIRNEQHFLKPKDTMIQDPLVEEGQIPKAFNWTIGPAQMKVGTIEQLVNKYPEQLKSLTEPNTQAVQVGGMTMAEREATVAQNALQPRNAALLVGAYFADKIDRLEHGLPPCPDRPAVNDEITKLWRSGDPQKRTQALIKSYNPSDADHVGNVTKQMNEIRHLHPSQI